MDYLTPEEHHALARRIERAVRIKVATDKGAAAGENLLAPKILRFGSAALSLLLAASGVSLSKETASLSPESKTDRQVRAATVITGPAEAWPDVSVDLRLETAQYLRLLAEQGRRIPDPVVRELDRYTINVSQPIAVTPQTQILSLQPPPPSAQTDWKAVTDAIDRLTEKVNASEAREAGLAKAALAAGQQALATTAGALTLQNKNSNDVLTTNVTAALEHATTTIRVLAAAQKACCVNGSTPRPDGILRPQELEVLVPKVEVAVLPLPPVPPANWEFHLPDPGETACIQLSDQVGGIVGAAKFIIKGGVVIGKWCSKPPDPDILPPRLELAGTEPSSVSKLGYKYSIAPDSPDTISDSVIRLMQRRRKTYKLSIARDGGEQ